MQPTAGLEERFDHSRPASLRRDGPRCRVLWVREMRSERPRTKRDSAQRQGCAPGAGLAVSRSGRKAPGAHCTPARTQEELLAPRVRGWLFVQQPPLASGMSSHTLGITLLASVILIIRIDKIYCALTVCQMWYIIFTTVWEVGLVTPAMHEELKV